MLSNSTSAIPPGNCGVHGYHGRTACPRCSTSALPFTPLIQSPPVSAAVSPAEPPPQCRVRLRFAWYDLWIGAYIDRANRTLYVCPLPTLLVEVRYGR